MGPISVITVYQLETCLSFRVWVAVTVASSQASLWYVTHSRCSMLCSHWHSFASYQGLWQLGTWAVPNRLSQSPKSARYSCMAVQTAQCFVTQHRLFAVECRLLGCDVYCRFLRTNGSVLPWYTASHPRNRILHSDRPENLKFHTVFILPSPFVTTACFYALNGSP